MANSYFQFKQFRVEQALAAMKVCTEACVFGASIRAASPQNILDIGTGTGLLGLMLAQRYNSLIDAVEMEPNAYAQAKVNFQNSPWKERLQVFHSSIQDFALTTSKRYDLIACNPPFFSRHLNGSDEAKNMAIHNQALPPEALVKSIVTLMKSSGHCYLLLPPRETEKFDTLALDHGLYVQSRIMLLNHKTATPFRYISRYGLDEQQCDRSTIIIKNEAGEYTEEFKVLLSPYYLYL